MKSFQRTAVAFLIGAGLSACGGGGSDSNDPPPPQTNQSPGGIWTVQYVQGAGAANAGDTMQGQALVTETGDAFFALIDTVSGCAVIGFGQVNVSGSSVSGSTNDAVVLWSPNPAVNTTCSYSDGSTSATTTLSGTVTQRSSFMLTDSSTTSMGMALGSETNTWSYSNLYSETPSLATLAGSYSTASGDTITISSDGTVFEQDPTTGCVINGRVSILNSSYNAYSISYTFANCTGNATALDGQTATGLGYYDDSVNPNQVDFGLHMTVNGQTLVLAGALTKM
jgi:hypothetical protein